MVFGAKINENYESDAKELEKVVAAGILLCRTFFYSPSSHLRKRGRGGLGIFGHDMSGFLQKTLFGMSQWLNNPSQWQARRRRLMVEVSERKTE